MTLSILELHISSPSDRMSSCDKIFSLYPYSQYSLHFIHTPAILTSLHLTHTFPSLSIFRPFQSYPRLVSPASTIAPAGRPAGATIGSTSASLFWPLPISYESQGCPRMNHARATTPLSRPSCSRGRVNHWLPQGLPHSPTGGSQVPLKAGSQGPRGRQGAVGGLTSTAGSLQLHRCRFQRRSRVFLKAQVMQEDVQETFICEVIGHEMHVSITTTKTLKPHRCCLERRFPYASQCLARAAE